jgi:hypothetical protein
VTWRARRKRRGVRSDYSRFVVPRDLTDRHHGFSRIRVGDRGLSSYWTTLELDEDLRVDPVAEFAGHQVSTLLL